MIILVNLEECPDCKKVREVLEESQLSHVLIPKSAEALKAFKAGKTVPYLIDTEAGFASENLRAILKHLKLIEITRS